jgi:hypothetical protein
MTADRAPQFEDHDAPPPRADSAIVDAARERSDLWMQALHAKALARQAADLRAQLAARERSRAWRFTAPFRRLATVVAARTRRGAQAPAVPTPSETSSASRE